MASCGDHCLPIPENPSLLRSLSDVASRINASTDLDTTLHHLLEAVCQETPWTSGGIMSIDQDEGYAQVIARHDPSHVGANLSDRWLLAESPSRLAVASNRPIIIADAQKSAEFPGYRREALEQGYRTVVVVPMEYRDPDGRRIVLSVRARDLVKVRQSDIALLQFVVHLGEIAMNKARSLAEEQAFGQQLRSALTAHGSLLDQVLAGGSVEAVAAKVMSLLPNPLVIADLTSRRVLACRSPFPDLVDDPAWCAAIDGDGRGQFLDLAQRALSGDRFDTRDIDVMIGERQQRVPAIICPLTVDGERVGALVVFSHASGFHDIDHLLLDSARFGLSVQMMRSYVAHLAAARSIEDLFADLLDGKSETDTEIVARARRLGIEIDQPARLFVFSTMGDDVVAGGATADLCRSIEERTRRVVRRATVVRRGGSIIVRLPDDRKRKSDDDTIIQSFSAEIHAALGEMPVVVETKPCRTPADYAAAWRECGRIRDLARRFGRRGKVKPEDFGPFPMLMSAVNVDEMHAFVQRLIGAVARHDAAHATAYLETLATFLNYGCRSQACADALGIHVTTLRYRIVRLKDLFAVETDTPDQRFALQLALQFYRVIDPRNSLGASRVEWNASSLRYHQDASDNKQRGY
jgi:DNA-binding PucR family transcriptional regulator